MFIDAVHNAVLPDGHRGCSAAGKCAAGIEEYKAKCIDEAVSVLQEFHGKVVFVQVIDLDSSADLSTNRGGLHCGDSAAVATYKAGIAYAVQHTAEMAPSVAGYLDAGHDSWLW